MNQKHKRNKTIYVNLSAKIRESIMCVKKNYNWNPSTCTCENDNYLGSIIGDSVIMYDEIIGINKTFSNKNCSKKNCCDKNCSNKTYSNN